MKTHTILSFIGSVTLLWGNCCYMDAHDRGETLDKPLPENWLYDSEMVTDSHIADDCWWHVFEDSILDSLIAQGLDNNYNLSIAARRLQIARHNIGVAKSSYYPTVGMNGALEPFSYIRNDRESSRLGDCRFLLES